MKQTTATLHHETNHGYINILDNLFLSFNPQNISLSSSQVVATKMDRTAEDEKGCHEYYYQLSHNDTVTSIYPPDYKTCYISIGNMEVLVHPMTLPFHSPSILNCKLKFSYETLPDKTEQHPYLHIRDAYQKQFRVFPMQLLAMGTPPPEKSSATPSSSPPPPPPLLSLLSQPTASRYSHPPSPPHPSLLRRHSPDRIRLDQPLRQPSPPVKRSDCCGVC